MGSTGPTGATGATGPAGPEGPAGPPGSGGNLSQAEIDFGSTPRRGGSFTIVDAAITATSKILAVQAGDAATGKSADDNELDALVLRCVPETGQFTLYADSVKGLVAGAFKINYTY